MTVEGIFMPAADTEQVRAFIASIVQMPNPRASDHREADADQARREVEETEADPERPVRAAWRHQRVWA